MGVSTARLALGTIAYGAIPVLAAVGILWVGSVIGVVDGALWRYLVGSILAIALVVFAGPPGIQRLVGRLPTESTDASTELLEDHVTQAADRIGVPVPDVTVVETGAPNVAVYGRTPESMTVVVSSRLPQIGSDASTQAVLAHALSRSERDVPIVSAMLPAVLAVETLVLLGIDLVRRADRDDQSDRRAVFGERRGRDLSGITAIAGAIAGVLLLVLVAPAWLLLAIGDWALVTGGRRAADGAVLDSDNGAALADWLVDAPDVSGYRDWPVGLDRLSVLPLAGGTVRSLRGTDRCSGRIREARLRTGRA